MSGMKPSASAPDISVVVVNYNSAPKLEQCLASLYADVSRLKTQVIVVDNASEDGSADMVERGFRRAELIRNAHNIGFARANNQAFEAARGRYVLLLNPDTTVTPGGVSSLVRFMDEHLGAAAVGPRIRNDDGSLQYSVRNFPSLRNMAGETLLLHRLMPDAQSLSEVVRNESVYARDQEVPWISGAAMLIRRQALDDIGPLDEEFFLYSEETDWCYRAWQAGWSVCYTPSAEIMHHHGASDSDPALFAHLVKSRLRFYAKHHSRRAARFYGLLLNLNLMLRMGGYFTLTLLDRRSTAKDKFELYWRGFTMASPGI